MDVGDFLRAVIVHIRLVLAVSLAVMGVTVLSSIGKPAEYQAQATLRVVPESPQFETEALDTATDWYAALGQVTRVAESAGSRMNPPMSVAEVQESVVMEAAGGPGEIQVLATGASPENAVRLANAMARSAIAATISRSNLSLQEMRLTILVTAQDLGPSGASIPARAMTIFLVTFVVSASAVGLLNRHINWRVTPAVLQSMAAEFALPGFDEEPALTVFLATRARESGQSWLAAGPGLTTEDNLNLLERVSQQGEPLKSVAVSDAGTEPAAPYQVLIAPPEESRELQLASVARFGAPVMLMIAGGTRTAPARRTLSAIADLGLTPMCISLVKRRKSRLGKWLSRSRTKKASPALDSPELASPTLDPPA